MFTTNTNGLYPPHRNGRIQGKHIRRFTVRHRSRNASATLRNRLRSTITARHKTHSNTDCCCCYATTFRNHFHFHNARYKTNTINTVLLRSIITGLAGHKTNSENRIHLLSTIITGHRCRSTNNSENRIHLCAATARYKTNSANHLCARRNNPTVDRN